MIPSYNNYNYPYSISDTPTCKSFQKDNARYGRTGLSNLGNTCYMNTAIQCLSHIPCIVEFLVSDTYKQYINKNNNSSTKGLVITIFAELLQKLWLGKDCYVTPSEFKSVVERFATIFQGYSQHDSQEFFITLLDLVHEDINSISTKPYIEYPVYSSFSDDQSSEMWSIHKQRNDSKIIDWFYGQTVSFIKCSLCNEQRIKYEPFSFLTLPLPPEIHHIYITILPGSFSGFESPTYPSYVNLCMRASASMHEVINSIASACGVSPKQVALYKKGYYEEYSEVSTFSLVGDLFHSYDTPTLISYILPEEKQEYDRFLLVYLSSIQLTNISVYSGETFEYLPYGLPFCFLLKDGESSFDLKEKIIKQIIQPLNLDCTQIGNQILEWDALCNKLSKNKSSSYHSSYTSYPESNDVSKSTIQYSTGLPGGSLHEESDSTVIISEDEVCPELSYLSENGNSPVQEDWQAHEPHLPILCKSYSSSDWKSSLILCNSSIPIQNRLYSSRSCLYLLVSAAITPNLRAAAENLSTNYYSDSKEEVQKDICTHPLSLKLSVPVYPVDYAKADQNTANNQDLHTCFQLFAKRNHLDEQNQWYCPHCQQHVCAENRTFIDKLPDVLVLQLERFEFMQAYGYSSYSSRRKITSLIDFPIRNLDMMEWMHSTKDVHAEDCIYDLKAICNHSGSSSGGHYFCFACDENDGEEVWNEYNDSSVYPLQEDSLVKDTAYVLFYQRRSKNTSTKSIIREFQSMIENSEDESIPNLQRPPILVSTEKPQCDADISATNILISNDSIDSIYNYCVCYIVNGMVVVDDTIGISFRNNCIMASILQNDRVEVLSSFDGMQYFPATITFHGNEVYCCSKTHAKLFPESTINNVLSLLGKTIYSEEIQKIENCITIPICENSNGKLEFFIENYEDEHWTVEKFLTHICSCILNHIETVINKSITQCILSVPDSIKSEEIEMLKTSVEKTGVRVLRIEKASLCIGYFIANESQSDERLLEWTNKFSFLFDIDDNEMTLSLIDFVNEKPHLVNSTTTSNISGEQIIHKVIAFIDKRINTEYGVDLFCGISGKELQRQYRRLYNDVEEQLSLFDQIDTLLIELPASCKRWLRRNKKIELEDIEVKERDVQDILKSMLDRAIQLINAFLVQNEVTVDNIFRVLSIGQFSYFSLVENMLIRIFGNEKIYKGHYRISCVAYGIGELLK